MLRSWIRFCCIAVAMVALMALPLAAQQAATITGGL